MERVPAGERSVIDEVVAFHSRRIGVDVRAKFCAVSEDCLGIVPVLVFDAVYELLEKFLMGSLGYGPFGFIVLLFLLLVILLDYPEFLQIPVLKGCELLLLLN